MKHTMYITQIDLDGSKVTLPCTLPYVPRVGDEICIDNVEDPSSSPPILLGEVEKVTFFSNYDTEHQNEPNFDISLKDRTIKHYGE